MQFKQMALRHLLSRFYTGLNHKLYLYRGEILAWKRVLNNLCLTQVFLLNPPLEIKKWMCLMKPLGNFAAAASRRCSKDRHTKKNSTWRNFYV